jgi:hypothetical protein
MTIKKPKGYNQFCLAFDCETSGLFFNSDNPAVDSKTGEYFQAVSWGLIIVDTTTLSPLEEVYIEIKWDGKSKWSDQAERVHGLTKSYLEDNGIARQEAVIIIADLILKWWGPNSPVCVLGHNPQFDLAFLRNDLRSEGLEVKFGSKIIDTNSIGFAVYNTHNSDDLFDMVGIVSRDANKHNALEDAKNALYVVKATRLMANTWLGEIDV